VSSVEVLVEVILAKWEGKRGVKKSSKRKSVPGKGNKMNKEEKSGRVPYSYKKLLIKNPFLYIK
jgi:hypothetical protein